MKKSYSRPDILFEDFTLSTNIAAGCEEQPDNLRENCGVRYGHYIIFESSMTYVCNRSPGNTGSDYYDQFCYHVNVGDFNVFFS